MNNFETYYTNERSNMIGFLPPKVTKCVEFGCSQGLFSKKVKELYNAECWGIDIDRESIDIAKQYLDKAILADAFEVIRQLPVNYFDCLICNDFLEHLAYPDIFLKEIKKCMKEGAFLVASFPNVRSWSNVLEFLIYKDWKYKEAGILDKTHLRFYTMKSLKRFLVENKLKIDLFLGTRPNKSIIFLILDIVTFGYHHDMKFNGIGVRAIF